MSMTLNRTNVDSDAIASAPDTRHALRLTLLACGMVGAALYPLADIVAAMRYPGFSYRDQAVSELFAIGAPTSQLVVTLFSISSTGIFLLGIAMWMSANRRRLMQAAAVMMMLNGLDAMVLWNFFPMHMRGVAPTFTDLMHGLLAIDPFLLAAIILVAIAYPGPFRVYTIVHLIVTTGLALTAVRYVPAVVSGEPTPWMGAAERAGQYATDMWYILLAVMLWRRRPQPEKQVRRS